MNKSMLLFSLILATVAQILCQPDPSDSTEFKVSDLAVSDKNKTAIVFTWTLPVNQSYSSFVFNYLIQDDETSQNVTLSKQVTTHEIGDLTPGSTVSVVITTLSSSLTVLASSDQVTAISQVEMVKSAEPLLISATSVQLIVEPPDSYYTELLTYCVMKPELSDQDSEGHTTWSFAPRGNNILQCESPEAGHYLTIYILTVKSDNNIEEELSDPYIISTQTALGTTSLTYTVQSATSITLTWPEVPGSYDHVDLDIRLVSTTAQLFYTNTAISRPECLVNSTIRFRNISSSNSVAGIEFTSPNYNAKLMNLCPMSNYDATLTISKPQFNSSVVYGPFRTSYENSLCANLTSKTVGNSTTLTWPKSPMQINYYTVRITYNHTYAIAVNVSGTLNSLIVYHLEFNTEYVFNIDATSPIIKSPTNKNFNLGPYSAPTCQTTFVTGPACPVADEEISLETAPYPNNVFIIVPQSLFTSPSLLHNITFITGVGKDCSNARKTEPSCYLAKFYTISKFIELSNNSFQISTQSACNQSDYCDIEFEMDKNYYITILGQGECGSVVSKTLRINIPSPFPLGVVVGVTVSVVVLLVIALLGVILFKSLKEIREMHYDELKNSMEEENHIKHLQSAKNEIVSMNL